MSCTECAGRERGVCVTCLCAVETETAVGETGLRRLPHGVRESPTSQDAPRREGPQGSSVCAQRGLRSVSRPRKGGGWASKSVAVAAYLLLCLPACCVLSTTMTTARQRLSLLTSLRTLHLHLSVSLLSPLLLRNSGLRISSLCIASADDSGRAVAQRSQTLHISVA